MDKLILDKLNYRNYKILYKNFRYFQTPEIIIALALITFPFFLRKYLHTHAKLVFVDIFKWSQSIFPRTGLEYVIIPIHPLNSITELPTDLVNCTACNRMEKRLKLGRFFDQYIIILHRFIHSSVSYSSAKHKYKIAAITEFTTKQSPT